MPQLPQLEASSRRFLHCSVGRVPHSARPCLQVHVPAVHSAPAGHAVPQALQWAALVLVSMHCQLGADPHIVKAAGGGHVAAVSTSRSGLHCEGRGALPSTCSACLQSCRASTPREPSGLSNTACPVDAVALT